MAATQANDKVATRVPEGAPDFSIVIVNFNGETLLRDCLRSLRETRGLLGLEVILVDNASRDTSVATARTEWPGVVLLQQSRNVGYVPANNVGLRRATGRYAMFLNNDTVLHPGCLQELLSFLDGHPEVGAASVQILNPDGSDQGTARRFPSVLNGVFGRRSVLTRLFPNNRWSRRYMLGRHQTGTDPFEVEILSSACMVVRTALANQLGGMDEAFTLYWVDAELCSRVRRLGYKVYCVPRARLTHFEGQGGSTKTWRQRFRATIAFHRDAYFAYVKVHRLLSWNARALMAAALLSGRAAMVMLLLVIRPWRATTSGGKN